MLHATKNVTDRHPRRAHRGTPRILGLLLCLALVSTAASATTVRYCIEGQSTGVGWSFDILSLNPPAGGAVSVSGDCPPVPPGSSSKKLARAFVNCINAAAQGVGQIHAAVDPNNPNYFTISSEHNEIHLSVGPAGGNADCEVTAAGCSFNPLIVRVTPPYQSEEDPHTPPEEPASDPRRE